MVKFSDHEFHTFYAKKKKKRREGGGRRVITFFSIHSIMTERKATL